VISNGTAAPGCIRDHANPDSIVQRQNYGARRGLSLATLAALDLLIAFAIQLYAVMRVGVGSATDAYFAGQIIPLSLYGIVQLPVQRAVVAVFAIRPDGVYPAARVWLMFTALAGCGMFVLAALAPFLLHYVFPALDATARSTAIHILWIQSATTVLMSGTLVLASLNQVAGRFVRCEVIALASTIASAMLILVTLRELGVVALALGALLKAGLSGLAHRATLGRQLGAGAAPWREIWSVVRPMAAAGTLAKMAPIIDRSIASAAAAGSLTLLTLGQTMYSATTVLAERAIVTPLLPGLRRSGKARDALVTGGWLAACGVVIATVLATGAHLASGIAITQQWLSIGQMEVLVYCLVALMGFGVGGLTGQWLSATLIVFGRADLSSRVALYGFVLSVPLKIVAFAVWGLYGLAFAISCYYVLNALAMAVLLRIIGRPSTAPSLSADR
jgi:hypothetical protein